MGPSEKSFNQVKAILGKLDRSIDQLRERRVTKPTPVASSMEAGRAIPAVPAPTPPPRTAYGRATPIQPTQ